MKKIFVLVPLVLMLAACGEESDVKKAVSATLIDPDSAKYGEFTKVGDNGACITVNAKNRLGGYTGNSEAFLIKIKDHWIVASNNRETSHETCVKIFSKSIAKIRILSESLK